MKKILILLIGVILLVSGGYYITQGKEIYFDNENISNVLSYSFKIENIKDIDKILKNKKFIYSVEDDYKYIAIITIIDNKAFLNQYKVKNGEEINVSVNEGDAIILSLPRNSTILYDWNIENELILTRLTNTSIIEMPFDTKGVGANFDRRNLYLNVIKTGYEKIELKYESTEDIDLPYYEIKINLEVK